MVEAGGGDSHDDWVKGMTVNKEALDLISEQGKQMCDLTESFVQCFYSFFEY